MFLNHECPVCKKIHELECTPEPNKLCPECEKDHYNKPCNSLYHVFSNGVDDWVDNEEKAVILADKWGNEYGCVRIYKETNWDYSEGLFMDEDCLFSFGEFPM